MMGSRFRTLVVGHSYVVGVNQSKLADVAATGVVEVGLLVPDGWMVREWQRRLLLERSDARIHVYSTPVWFEGRSGAYLYPPWAVARAVREFRPDLIHVEQEVFSLSAFEMTLVARLARVPLVVFCWENVDRRLSLLRCWTRAFVLRTVQLVIAGNSEALELLRSWGYSGSGEVLPQFGVDTSLFRYVPNRRSGEVCTIGFVGRLVQEKGVDLLLAATRELAARGCQFRVIICGAGPRKQALVDQARRLGVAALVEWRDAVHPDRVPDVMGGCDVLVLPSRRVPAWKEQFGRVLIEAMAMGIPVVGSSCGEIPNVVGCPDLIFPEEDAAGLAAILERMIRDPEWRSAMGQFGLARVRAHYTQERIATRLAELWRTVLNKQGKDRERD